MKIRKGRNKAYFIKRENNEFVSNGTGFRCLNGLLGVQSPTLAYEKIGWQ